MANAAHVLKLTAETAQWNEWRLDDPDHVEAIRRDYQKALDRHHHSLVTYKEETKYWTTASYVADLPSTPPPPDFRPVKRKAIDLKKAELSDIDLGGIDLSGADLRDAVLRNVNLARARLDGALCERAQFLDCQLSGCDLCDARFSRATIRNSFLRHTRIERVRMTGVRAEQIDFSGCRGANADFRGAKLDAALFREAKLDHSCFQQAQLRFADFYRASLNGARFSQTNLAGCRFIETDLCNAQLTNARVYGVSTWQANLTGAKQESLVITSDDEPELTVDNLEVAQFLYLLIRNEKLREVIDTLTSKAVLILGNFSAQRIVVLKALRQELRSRGYLPILFDFDKPSSRDLTSTIVTLAGLSRFVIADVSSPRAVPYELASIVPTTPVPLQRIIHQEQREVSMIDDLQRRYSWVLPTHSYASPEDLLANLGTAVIQPLEAKLLEMNPRTLFAAAAR